MLCFEKLVPELNSSGFLDDTAMDLLLLLDEARCLDFLEPLDNRLDDIELEFCLE